MQRLALAVILLAVVVALAAFGAMAARRALDGMDERIEDGRGMQRISFVLLVALTVYVAFAGGS